MKSKKEIIKRLNKKRFEFDKLARGNFYIEDMKLIEGYIFALSWVLGYRVKAHGGLMI